MTDEAKPWVMPEWMEPYRDLIGNTGGNSVEDLMNDRTTDMRSNHIRTTLILSVATQVSLLDRLHNTGSLVSKCMPEAAPEIGEMVLIDAIARCDGDGVTMVLSLIGSDGKPIDHDVSPDRVHWHPAK